MRTLAQPGNGGKEASRNPFSPRPRSNDEFREAGPCAGRRARFHVHHQSHSRPAPLPDAGLPCFKFRFLRRPHVGRGLVILATLVPVLVGREGDGLDDHADGFWVWMHLSVAPHTCFNACPSRRHNDLPVSTAGTSTDHQATDTKITRIWCLDSRASNIISTTVFTNATQASMRCTECPRKS